MLGMILSFVAFSLRIISRTLSFLSMLRSCKRFLRSASVFGIISRLQKSLGGSRAAGYRLEINRLGGDYLGINRVGFFICKILKLYVRFGRSNRIFFFLIWPIYA